MEMLGEDIFLAAYEYILKERSRDTEDDIVRYIQIVTNLENRFGKKLASYCFLVDQLIYFEREF